MADHAIPAAIASAWQLLENLAATADGTEAVPAREASPFLTHISAQSHNRCTRGKGTKASIRVFQEG